MDQEIIFYAIVGMALVTYLPRVLPILVLTNRSLPDFVISWLSYVPAAVLAALLIPSILLQNGNIEFGFKNIFLWASIPTLAMAAKTKNLYVPVILGMLLVIIFRLVF